MKKILSYLRRAVDEYEMIAPGDKIAVGVSGGKDSTLLVSALSTLKRFYPVNFEIEAITLDMGYENVDFSSIKCFCDKLGVNHTVVETGIKNIVFDIRKEKNPCSLCANLRSGALNKAAVDLGCNKVALGHHNDDVVETFFLSLFYEGRVHCFSPVTYLDRKNITVIRPFIYVPERQIISAVKRLEIPICKNPCPADGYTKRQEMKEFFNQKSKEDAFFKERIFTAIKKSNIKGWKQ